MNPICIYHRNCNDGFAAALAVHLAIPDAEIVAGHYGDEPPDVTGRDVFLVDFSYPRDTLIRMAENARSILVLDHHVSAEKALVDLPDNVSVIFDQEHSGAVLAWRHFHTARLPPIFRHIEDRDLWQFKLTGTQNITAALSSFPHDLGVWKHLLKKPIGDLDAIGQHLLRKHKKDVESLIRQGAHRITVAGWNVPAINAPLFYASDAGHILGAGERFAVTYCDFGGYRNFSLRSSSEGGLDVSEIAADFGGGGHKHAAGFRIKLDSSPGIINSAPLTIANAEELLFMFAAWLTTRENPITCGATHDAAPMTEAVSEYLAQRHPGDLV